MGFILSGSKGVFQHVSLVLLLRSLTSFTKLNSVSSGSQPCTSRNETEAEKSPLAAERCLEG